MIKVLRLDNKATVPTRANPNDAGLDLYSIESCVLSPGERHLFSTGIAISIPKGYRAKIEPRSGMANKMGINVLGGVIDSDYRGEIKVILISHGHGKILIAPGSRIAQLVIHQIELWNPVIVDTLEDTERGAGGFGSSGS